MHFALKKNRKEIVCIYFMTTEKRNQIVSIKSLLGIVQCTNCTFDRPYQKWYRVTCDMKNMKKVDK